MGVTVAQVGVQRIEVLIQDLAYLAPGMQIRLNLDESASRIERWTATDDNLEIRTRNAEYLLQVIGTNCRRVRGSVKHTMEHPKPLKITLRRRKKKPSLMPIVLLEFHYTHGQCISSKSNSYVDVSATVHVSDARVSRAWLPAFIKSALNARARRALLDWIQVSCILCAVRFITCVCAHWFQLWWS